MLKRISAAVLALTLFLGLAGITLAASSSLDTQPQEEPASQSDPAAPEEADAAIEPAPEPEPSPEPVPEPEPTPEPEPEPIDSNFWLNGQPVPGGMTVRVFDSTLYCSIRAFFTAALCETEVSWTDGQAQVKGTTAGGEALTLTARPGDCWITVNGRCMYVEHGVRLEDGVTMAPLRVLAWVFPGTAWFYHVDIDRTTVTLANSLLASGADFYNADDLDLIARVIYQEARNEPMRGKIALGNVITNRVAQGNFPNSVHDVIYAPNQFTVVNTKRFWNQTPSAACITAAKLALEGVSIMPTAVYYNVKGLNSWASRNRPYVGAIGNHSFYSG